MNYKQIEVGLDNVVAMEDFLKKYLEIFNRIEAIGDMFRRGEVDNPIETDRVMKELAGLQANLNLVAVIADTVKQQQEAKLFLERKMELKDLGEKVITTQIEKEIAGDVHLYRRFRNIFQAYRDTCGRLISVCQSSLRNLNKEFTT